MNAVIDAWREQIEAHERDAAALRGGDAHGHGHGGHAHRPGGHGGFAYSNRPLDPFRTDDPVLNSLFAALSPDTPPSSTSAAARESTPCPLRRARSTLPSSSRLRTPSRCCEAVRRRLA